MNYTCGGLRVQSLEPPRAGVQFVALPILDRKLIASLAQRTPVSMSKVTKAQASQRHNILVEMILDENFTDL